MKNENHGPLTIRVIHDLEKSAKLQAFVVNNNGKIVETALFDGKEAKFKTDDVISGDSKIYIANAIPKELEGKANETILIKAGAYEVVKNLTDNFIDVVKLPIGIFLPWFYNNCLITGHLNKNFYIDGQTRNLPICNARVHICEVETELLWPFLPIYKRKIPDWVIYDISEKFKNIKENLVQPHPIPDPIGPVSQQKLHVDLQSLSKNIHHEERKQSKSLQPLESHIIHAMTSDSISIVRKAMIDYHKYLYPYLCLWPIYWPWIYTYDEETIVYSDCNGHFEMWENTFTEDGPLNIYIWVEVNINGKWVTVYKPPVPCYTWWNYKCNTNINIQVSDYRVSPCDCSMEGPADAVWFRSIGNAGSALHLEQNPFSTTVLQSATLRNGGCTDIIDGKKISPFGGELVLNLFCGANIFNAGVTHYRWKKTMIADANQNPVSGSTSIIMGNVTRPYLVKMTATHYETHYCSLGIEGSGTDLAYRIPHHDVNSEPVATLQDPADVGRSPEWTNIFFDSSHLDSHSLNDGIYKFELELLKKQADGSFHMVPVAKPTYQISTYNIIGDNENAPDNYLNINSGNPAKADSYKMHVRIDNAHCVGLIHQAKLNETGALSGSCGFIHYTNNGQHIHISFEASHPRNFATFSFSIIKGDGSQPTGINPSGYVISGVDGFSLSGLFSKDFTVLSLLNGCINQAAFAENLYVAALATDGSDRLNTFDASDIKAFALSNT